MEQMTFAKLNISKQMLARLNGMGFTDATPVQALAIDPLMNGLDAAVQAPTGTGKTLAFGIPILERIDSASSAVQTVILCPTRELALQITSVLRGLAGCKPGVRMAAIYGGEKIEKQFAALRRNPQIIIATPGRLLDHMGRRTISLQDVNTVVLDEADRMLDMGFRPDLNRILDNVPEQRQTALFSATLSSEILAIAETYQRDPQILRVEQASLTVESVRQYYSEVLKGAKEEKLYSLLKEEKYALTLVFVNTKRMAKRLAERMQERGFRADALHGDMRQSQRERVMKQYRTGKLDMLIATDVASRGIDVSNIDAVINYDIPLDSESYVHRIGRTGRADQSGIAHTLIYPEERAQLKTMMRGIRAMIIPTGPELQCPEAAEGKTKTVNLGYNRNGTRNHRRSFSPRTRSRSIAGGFR
jgi:ATP-dependent RNA helicase DeaD